MCAIWSKSLRAKGFRLESLPSEPALAIPAEAPTRRTPKVLTDPVFHKHHAEHEMLRFLTRLSSRRTSP